MKSKICLIRHGITEGNKRRLYYGTSDIPLAPEGVEELTRLTGEGIYPRFEDADYYTTGLQRTEQTLKLIYGEIPHKQMENLREINFGDFEMKSHDEIKHIDEYQKWVRDRSGNLKPPNGESIIGFSKRILTGFEELRSLHALKELSLRHSEREAVSVVVCHGGTISAILDHLYPCEDDNFYRWIPDPGHGYLLSLEDGVVIDREKF